MPTEYEEQCALVDYLELKGLLFSKVAQETFTKSWQQKMKNRRSGLRKGLPDMFIYIPPERAACNVMLLAIEMKRPKGGRVSPEQKVWLESLDGIPHVAAKLANGFEEAKVIVDKYVK